MGENLVTPNFTAGLNFSTSRDRPVKQGIKPGDSRAALAGLDVLQKGREPADELASGQRFGDGEKLLRAIPRLRRRERPKPAPEFHRAQTLASERSRCATRDRLR